MTFAFGKTSRFCITTLSGINTIWEFGTFQIKIPNSFNLFGIWDLGFITNLGSKYSYNAGYCCNKGIGVEKDEHKVFVYYQKSTVMGDASEHMNATKRNLEFWVLLVLLSDPTPNKFKVSVLNRIF